jgi:hypothetical protein
MTQTTSSFPLCPLRPRGAALAAVCLALAALAACSKQAAPAAADTANSSVAPAQAKDDWDDSAAAKLIAADSGQKQTYVCQFIFPESWQTGTNVRTMDRPAIEARKVSISQESIEATSADQAHKIMEAATSHSLQIGPCTADLANTAVDTSVPLSSYETLQSGLQIALLYYGLDKTPLPATDLAQSFDPDYQRTTDTFKRQDLLAGVQARFGSQQQKLLASPYLRILASASLGHYDPQTKSFPLLDFGVKGDTRFEMNDSPVYGVVVRGDPRFASIVPASEADARALEAKISASGNGSRLPVNLDVYVKAADTLTFASRKDIVAKVAAVRVADTNNSPIADIR